MGASTWGTKTSKAGRMQAFRHSTCHTTTHTERHREIPDCIYPFPHMHSCVMRHSPTCIIALCDIPPHAFLRYTCRLCEGLGATRRAPPYGFAYLQTCEGLGVTRAQLICRPAKGLGQISVTLCIFTLRSLGRAYCRHAGH